MIIHKENIMLDIDIEKTFRYSETHSLCDCDECRNFYIQAREKLPKLTEFLSELGIMIERPDEIGSYVDRDCVDYHFVSYTIIGEILESDEYEIDMFDGGLYLNIAINHFYVPNEQETRRYFTVTVSNIVLPWVLNEPFPNYC